MVHFFEPCHGARAMADERQVARNDDLGEPCQLLADFGDMSYSQPEDS